jgi:nitrogen-specific signal transduction histidine kinase/GAF domain-containing protein
METDIQKSQVQILVSPALAAETSCDDYQTLLTIVNRVTSAPSGQAAMETLFRFLQERCGLLALTMEVTSGPVTRFYPYGDVSEVAALNADSGGERQRVICVCPLKSTLSPLGKITYILAAETHVTSELLEAATAQIALRLGLELLTERAEQAEGRARQRISELVTLYDIGQPIDPGELPQLMQMITDRTALLMDGQACSLMVVDEEQGRLRLAASHGLPAGVPEYGRKIGEGISGRVAATEQSMLIVGGEHDRRLDGLTLNPDIGSSMVVPMKDQGGKVLGVLAIRRRRSALDFTTEDLKLFEVFATQAALAVTNARLYADLRSRMSELLNLTTLSRTLISKLDLDGLLEAVADEVRNIVNFERCCLYIRDNNRPIFVPRVWRGYSASIGRNPVREGEGAVGLTARVKTMQRFDAQVTVPPGWERERSYLQMKGYARSLGTDAFVAVPILDSHQRCVGVLVADNRGRREPISAAQTQLLEAFVNQAGIAIDNSLLYAQMQDTLSNIRRLKDYTDSILHSIGAAIVSTDTRGIITRWNPAAQQTLQLPAAAFRETQLTALLRALRLPRAEQEQLIAMIAHVQETGETVQRFRLTLHPQDRPSVTLYLMISRLPDHRQERAGVVLIFEDVTQEVRLETELEKMSRLADIGQLAAKMAHEVRNALSPIRAAAQIIQGDLSAQNISTEWTEIIVAEVDGLARLTREMLDFARPTSLAVRTLNLNDFLGSSVQTLASFLNEHRVQVEWGCASDLPELMGDAVQLGQVVRNIVMNAAQSMSDGGVLCIRTAYDPATELFAMEFHDNGEGIAEGDLERIFRPFVTTRTKGTGLGLPIVQKIVDHHGGRVEVESHLARGTCFRVLLPPRPPHDSGERLPQDRPLISPKPTGNFPD